MIKDMGFRNIVLPQGESANVLETDTSMPIPTDGRFKTIKVGSGGNSMSVDKDGMRLGNENNSFYPFKVDMKGNTDIQASSVNPDTKFRWRDPEGNVLISIGFGYIDV